MEGFRNNGWEDGRLVHKWIREMKRSPLAHTLKGGGEVEEDILEEMEEKRWI